MAAIWVSCSAVGITLSRELSAFLALGFNSGAYQAEYLRGSLLAIGDGQMMAGRSSFASDERSSLRSGRRG